MKNVEGTRSDSWLKGPPQNPPDPLGRAASLSWSQGAMEMEGAAASTRFHQPHMERKMSAMTCEIFNELRLEGKLCDVVIKVNGFEFNAHKNILCSCSSYFRYNRVAEQSQTRGWVHVETSCFISGFPPHHFKFRGSVKALGSHSLCHPKRPN